jgi:hypothetical protein
MKKVLSLIDWVLFVLFMDYAAIFDYITVGKYQHYLHGSDLLKEWKAVVVRIHMLQK